MDDSTVSGVLECKGSESYERLASSHKMFDYMNIDNSSDKRTWAPFYFLPPGEGNTLQEKSICKPDCAIARAMVAPTIESRSAENALHRLGITLHVYVDTWAHQNSTGTISKEDGLPPEAKSALAALLESNRSNDPIERWHVLTTALANGKVPGLSEDIPACVAKGAGSWKVAATGIIDADADGDNKPKWPASSEQSGYRKFHDVIKEHRFVATQLIPPIHGVRLV